jgi:hypothetical protein
MTLEEFQSLQVGDRVLVHVARDSYHLRPGIVVSQGRFDAQRLGVHVGIKILATGALLYPSWEIVHRFGADPPEACRFCDRGRVGESSF